MKSLLRSSEILLGGLVMLLAFHGCAVGPNYKMPASTVAPSFSYVPTNGVSADEDKLAAWWRSFEDTQLTHLVEEAIARNHDLRIATANLKQARALRRIAALDLLPTVHANAGYQNGLLSEAAAPGVERGQREGEFYDAGFDATWELDLFGRVRRSVEAADASIASVDAERADVLVSLTSEVARNYFELRGLQLQLAVAQRNAEVQNQTLQLTQSLLDGGRGTEFDVARSRALLNLTRSLVPSLEAEIARTIYRIAVLTGQQPVALVGNLATPLPLPSTFPPVAISDPASLLRRRPDIRAAERALAAQTARIGIVTADLFPRVTFIGRIGLEAKTFSGLGQAGADTWSFGPRITWAAFDLGRVRAHIKAADARTEAALAFYERSVLLALEETEATLVEFSKEQARQELLQESERASQTAANLARQRFEGGSADFLSVLDAERTLLEAQDRLATSQKRTVTALVAVFKALGAGKATFDP